MFCQSQEATCHVRWIATSLLVAGGIAVSGSIRLAQEAWAFAPFAIGHMLWLVVALKAKDRPLFALNLGLLLLDTYAIVIRL